jgi:hypothetical protein
LAHLAIVTRWLRLLCSLSLILSLVLYHNVTMLGEPKIAAKSDGPLFTTMVCLELNEFQLAGYKLSRITCLTTQSVNKLLLKIQIMLSIEPVPLTSVYRWVI